MLSFLKISGIIIALLVVAGFIFYQIFLKKQMGRLPTGARLERIEKSPNYKNGKFQNQSKTTTLAEGYSYWGILKLYLNKPKTEPDTKLPFVKTDLNAINDSQPVLVWFGHSSYFIKIKGKNILVDPVFSGHASPFSFSVKSYDGANEYKVSDFPDLDAVIISHDHYDHLDYETILQLIPKTKKFYTSLGVGEHLEYWGVNPNDIAELDWWENTTLFDGISLTAAPARHFSGRGFATEKSLWSSFILSADGKNYYLGGDSGYDNHFKAIGEKYGPFELAILECGQYNEHWRYIHMLPEEVATAANELKAKSVLPVHWSKFTLSVHPWNEPIERLSLAAKENGITLITPQIGQKVVVGKDFYREKWW